MVDYASATVLPRRQRAIAWPTLPGAFGVGWALCAILVGAFELKAPSSALWLLSFGILACGARLMERRPVDALAILPVVSLIGPIARVAAAGGASIQLGDLYLALILAYFLIGRGLRGRIALGPERVRIGAIGILAVFSWAFSIDALASIVPIIGIIQLLLAYVITINVVKSRDDVEKIVWGWLGAVAISSALIISAYVRGEVLLLDSGAAYSSQFHELTLSTTFLFRATFFVSGVIFPLAAGAVVTATLLLFPRRGARLQQLALGAFLITDLLAMGLLANKTAMFAEALCTGMMVVWAFRSRSGAIRAGVAAGVIFGVLLLGFALIRQVMSTGQFLLFFARFGEGASFWERTAVWRRVGDYLLESPHALYLGLGPDVSIRRLDHPLFRHLFVGGGIQQGAVDSGFLYVVLNYGVFVLLFALAIAAKAWTNLTKTLLRGIDPVALSLWITITIWVIMATTQQHGVSKPVFMIVQVLALVHASWMRPGTFFVRWPAPDAVDRSR